ncbi:MAG: hypothetical protein ANABAC_3280 [Anaerolineae bacterium]|nr:MAG: hypothetical protein ANABAC_3280 [Anaerolineae bacterium]
MRRLRFVSTAGRELALFSSLKARPPQPTHCPIVFPCPAKE